MDTAFATDPMLKLLTEALRRGPGSPEWHRAVSALRDVTTPEADEYRLLITARERIESGRSYREVRAGPAFTRELFGEIDKHANTAAEASRMSIGLVLRLLCLLVFVGAIGVVVMRIAQSRPDDAQALSGRLFITPVRSWTFASLPTDLRTVGPLPLEANGVGLRAANASANLPAGGVLLADERLDLQHGTCVEMRLDYKPGPMSLQLSLMQAATVTGPLATLSNDVSLVCDSAGVRLSSPSAATAPRALAAGSHLLRIKVLGDAAVAEVDGQVLWSGTQSLGPRAFVGVRFVREGKAGDVAVQSLRVLAP